MAEVKWIKITTDMFDHDKLDFIESLPDSDSIIIIWIRLLTLAGKANAGGFVLLTESIPYTEDMLSHKFRKPLNTIKLALETLKRLNMIDYEGGSIVIRNWEKHQNIDALERIKEQTKKRVQKHRETKKIAPVTQCNVTVTDDVTHGNATEVEVDLELDKEIKDTTTAGDEFKSVLNAFCEIHGKAEHQVFNQITDMQHMIDKGIPSEIIISVMREKHEDKLRRGESVNSFSYYQKAIIEKWEGGKKLEEYGGNTKGIRLGSNQTQSSRSEGESKVYRGKWDDTVIPMPKMSG